MPGLDNTILDQLDPELALGRILTDVNSDFILAPHFSAVYANVGQDLWNDLRTALRSGNYEPELPITIEVPKPSGLTRPGSILVPRDRLIYQALVDFIAPIAESQLDRARVFSQVLLNTDPKFEMFSASHIAWGNFQESISAYCQDDILTHAIKADVASFFERLYQHNLVNLLRSSGCPGGAINLLEELLLSWMERDSHGIVQGIFPSDFLGNFYLFGLDSDLDVRDVPSARYVDDLFIFYRSLSDARRGLVNLCRMLRHEGLHLNERKSGIKQTNEILNEETLIDRMFQAAREEIESQRRVNSWYGFQTIWLADQSEDDEDIELQAVEALYAQINDIEEVSYANRIEKFCLPYLAASGSEIGVDRSLIGIIERPYLTKIYSSYLSAIAVTNADIFGQIEGLVSDERLAYDWQLMWVVAALTRAENVSAPTINSILRLLRNTTRSVALRGLCAIVVGIHGNPAQRRNLRHHYQDEPSEYVRTAILFSTRYFPVPERRSCLNAWSGHSVTHTLVSEAVRRLI